MLLDDFTPPQWLEEYRLDDDLRANAYENACLSHKAGIKSALALHFAIENERHNTHTVIQKSAFHLEYKEKPSELSLFIVEKEFDSSAQFIASILPALFAKSEVCIAFREIPDNTLLLALELLGLEQVFVLPQATKNNAENIEKLCMQFQAIYKGFVVVLLGKNSELENFFIENNLKYQSFYYESPTIICGTQKENFLAAYPQARVFSDFSEMKYLYGIDIVSKTAQNIDSISDSVLILSKGLEWYTPCIFSSEFFTITRKQFSFIE